MIKFLKLEFYAAGKGSMIEVYFNDNVIILLEIVKSIKGLLS
jgi:hypothetical protein